ncbi:MAG: hypothetical protein OXT68_08775 [Chloroflexota bacterium]|nr:hypothetical protein [Chloroflexota bacterium]
MSLFVVFIVAAVLLGAGAMLSPAWRSAQPRVALAATLCLALIVGGAVFYAEAFAWDTLAVDYLLFALLSGVVLGGTLSTAQARAEARGELLADRDQGWPGPHDLAFFALAAIAIIIPLVHLPAALGAGGQITGFHSLTTLHGESFRSLAPFDPHSRVIVSPGFHALSAYLSGQLSQPIPLIQLSLAAVSVYLLVWLAYDFGAELRDKRLGRALAIATLMSGSIHLSYLDGHFVELLALLFLQAFLLYALRFLREFNLADLIAGGLMLGAVCYTSLTISIIALLGFGLLCLLIWTRVGADSTRKSRWGYTIGFPLVALLGIAPWLYNSLTLIFPISPSPHPAEIGLLANIVIGNGIVIIPLAVWGITIALRAPGSLRLVSLLMLLWLALILEFSLVGFVGKLLPPIGALVNAPNMARHGTILPFSWFGGLALLRLWETNLPQNLKRRLRQLAYPLIAATGLLLLALGVAFQPIVTTLRPLLNLPEQTLTRDDYAAMLWLRDNAPEDAVVLSADGQGWLPLVAERRAVDFRAVAYFEWDIIHEAIDTREADFVFQPSAGADLPDLPLTLVFEQGEARVYYVSGD